MKAKYFFILFFSLLVSQSSLQAQSDEPSLWSIYGDVRVSYTGNSESLSDFGNNALIMRLRPGVKYRVNENHSLSARMAYRVSDELEELDVTAQARSGGLGLGQLSFDEFYYQYKADGLLLKAGRF